jgi:intergrase/recombinase
VNATSGAEHNHQFNWVIEMDDYEKYEKECKNIRIANKLLLNEFEVWLKSTGLSEKTINNHLSNIDFFVNEYLLYEDATEAKDGSYAIGMFLGYWFIRKAMWASQSSIKSNATSLKKFYTFMHEKGLIDKEDLTILKRTIKEEMPEWLATLRRYDDLSIDDVW